MSENKINYQEEVLKAGLLLGFVSVFITLVFSLGISVIISYFSTSIITGRYISSNIEKLY